MTSSSAPAPSTASRFAGPLLILGGALALAPFVSAAMALLATVNGNLSGSPATASGSVAGRDISSYHGSFAPTSTNDLMTPVTPPPGSPWRD